VGDTHLVDRVHPVGGAARNPRMPVGLSYLEIDPKQWTPIALALRREQWSRELWTIALGNAVFHLATDPFHAYK
jgi:hypothetical protein